MSEGWFRKKKIVIERKMNQELENVKLLLNDNMVSYQIILKHANKKYSKQYINELSIKEKIELFEYFRWICNLYISKDSKKFTSEGYKLYNNKLKKFKNKSINDNSSYIF